MKIRQILAVAVLAAMATPAWACSQLPAFVVWVGMNDGNQDGALSQKEFLRAKKDDNLVLKLKLNKRTFRKLDRNKNGLLERSDQEWYRFVEYKRAPCADWEEKMQQMLQQEKRENSELNQARDWLPAQ